MYVYIYIYIYIYIERDVYTCLYLYVPLLMLGYARSPVQLAVQGLPLAVALLTCNTASFHNFKSQNFKLRVSNPNKLIVDVFLTRCRISMCQGLGPKNTMKLRKSTVSIYPSIYSTVQYSIAQYSIAQYTPGLRQKIPVFSDPAPGKSQPLSMKKTYLSNPAPGESILSGNLVMETGCTASFHNFKSSNFKLSVSNPKIKYVAYVSVLSQISNSQGLGRKNNFEI